MLIIIAVIGPTDESVSSILKKIQEGDKHLKDKFITDFNTFIIKIVVSSHVLSEGKHKSDVRNTDEYSIGLIAFNEAIDCYNGEKRAKFVDFAETVIRRRLTDYYRYKSKSMKEYPFTYFNREEQPVFEDSLTDNLYPAQFERIEMIQEINHLTAMLKVFGIDMQELKNYVPKHRDSKKLCLGIAKIIAQNEELFKKLLNTRNIPMTNLLKLIQVHPRTVERNRKYIISASLILGMGYEHLKSYVSEVVGGDSA